MPGEADSFILLILAIIFPPAAAAFVAGCGADFCINVLLTLIGYLPGCIHAFWLVLRRSEANERYGYKNWTYTGMGEYAPQDAAQRPVTYGATNQAPPPPPPGAPYPASKQAPSSSAPAQAAAPEYVSSPVPVDQKQAASQPPPEAPPPEAPPIDQKAVQVATSATPADQKPTEPAPQYTPTPTGEM